MQLATEGTENTEETLSSFTTETERWASNPAIPLVTSLLFFSVSSVTSVAIVLELVF
jgi:hypothetical protein